MGSEMCIRDSLIDECRPVNENENANKSNLNQIDLRDFKPSDHATATMVLTDHSAAPAASQLERLAQLAKDLNGRGAAQAVMTTRLVRAGKLCRLPLAGGPRRQRCGVLYLTDWTLESANTDESPTFSDDDPEGEREINERRATIDNVGSFLSFLDNDSATDAARPAETLSLIHI